FTRYIPAEVRTGIQSRREQIGDLLAGRNCAGWEYPAIVRDEQQFALFWRTLPWDHAPGALFVEEAGGVAWRLDGTPYHPADTRTGLLVAQTQQIWDTVRSTLLAGL
ncbi:MAG TPA: inositol monophosphatase family protein, partial [Micromonosporaceae bacterium]